MGWGREYLVLVLKSLTLEILLSFLLCHVPYKCLFFSLHFFRIPFLSTRFCCFHTICPPHPWIMMMWRYYLRIRLKQIPVCPFSITLRQDKDRESRTEKCIILFTKEEGLYFTNKLMWGYSFIFIQSGKTNSTKKFNHNNIQLSCSFWFRMCMWCFGQGFCSQLP